jgi:branched-chain amino acid transport system permease protein
METTLLIETAINVVVLSSMYILVALGFAFLFNMLGILNLAHGTIYMIGGYVGFTFITGLGINQWVALILSVVILAVFGVFLEKFCFRPFVGDFNRTVMVCIAIMVTLQTTVNLIAGTKTQALPTFVAGNLQIGQISISNERVVTFVIGVILLWIVVLFVRRNKLGQQMQAIAQNMRGAALQGISIHRVSAFACAMGCGLAAIAGCLMGAYLNLSPLMGDIMIIKVLMLIMIAGVGSMGGVLVSGFVLGGLDAILPMWIVGAGSDAVAVVIVVILLLIRPKGFFGHEA